MLVISLVVLGNASFNVDDFYNRGKIDVANDLTISANSFVNTHTEGDGNINADTLALSLIGDFDYALILEILMQPILTSK